MEGNIGGEGEIIPLLACAAVIRIPSLLWLKKTVRCLDCQPAALLGMTFGSALRLSWMNVDYMALVLAANKF
jgi:hypothetical protein